MLIIIPLLKVGLFIKWKLYFNDSLLGRVQMRPVLFQIWGIKIYGYGLMIALGILAALILLNYRAKKREYNEEKIFDMAILAIVFGVLGGKLMYIITDIKNIIGNPSILKDIGSGFVVYGSILGGLLGVYIYCRMKKWDLLKIVDLVVPSLPLAQGFGRFGCFLAGCCYGRETSLGIGVVFPSNPLSLAPSGIHLLPTQIYSSVFDFCLAGFLLWYDKKERKAGRVFSMYLIIYSIGRFFVEYLRSDVRGNVGVLSTSQFISIFVIILGIFLYNYERLKKNKKGRC
jgi:phosphatidylglycerol:prolipoprotein diacylglycerol transferase